MLVFHGERGLELSSMTSKPLSWVLGNGLTLCFWVNIENVKQGSELELPKLFTFYSQGYGGLESYLVDNKVHSFK